MTAKITALLRLLCVACLTISATASLAEDTPTGRVILEVSGNISDTNSDGGKKYDLEMLEALGTHQIITETPWTEGPITFTGVLARDVLADAGATGKRVKAIALNDYSVEIPMMDFDAYGVILALQRDGQYLTIRDRGPIWVIYPWSNVTDLQNELYYSRSIWQLRTIEVRPN